MNLWKLNKKQKKSLKLIEKNKFSCLIGQGRSSKTTLAVYYLFKRALLYPNTSHCIFRNTLQSAKDGIFGQTVKEVIKHFFPILPALSGFKINESSMTISFPNGSRILIRGLDTEERATKVLSQQFLTILLDEGQTIKYTYLALLMTRTPQPKDCKGKVKIIVCANWASQTHWMKYFFLDKVNPETKVEHNLSSDFIKFVTEDNESIDAKEYINTLNAAGDRRARLMCAGDAFFSEAEGALWKQDDIQRTERLKIEEYDEIIIAFDPCVSNTKHSDGHGIALVGKKNDDYHILEAYEKQQDVNLIAQELVLLYHKYQCSRLVIEVNNGGDWIPRLINNHDASVLCDTVRATRGKLVRAEPVAGLYVNGLVYHCSHFQELEDQMLTYCGSGSSPNSLDALVWGVTYLNEKSNFVNPEDI